MVTKVGVSVYTDRCLDDDGVAWNAVLTRLLPPVMAERCLVVGYFSVYD